MTSRRERNAVDAMLDEADVPPEGTFVLHSAFGNLGRVDYRAESFIESLLDRNANGNVLMPAMSWRNVTPGEPVWDELSTFSHVGVLPELFRIYYATARSIHPTHSVCGVGPLTSTLLTGHHCGDTPCSRNSPWGRLADHEAHILLLGTNFERCTALHHPEEILASQIYLEDPASAASYRCTSRDATVYNVRLRRHRKLNRDFGQYGLRLAAKGLLRTGRVAGVEWMAVSARDLMDDAFANLAERPDAHIRGLEGATPRLASIS